MFLKCSSLASSSSCNTHPAFNKRHLPKQLLDEINSKMAFKLNKAKTFTQSQVRKRKVTFLALCSARMQAHVIFLPSCPRAQGDCASLELSHAIGIKVSLTGTPQGRREKRRLVSERIGEGEDGGCRWDAPPDDDESDEVWHPRL